MNTGIRGILPFTVIVLPPGSTSSDLITTINAAASGDVIEISSDMNFASTITVPAEKMITIQSSTPSNWVLARAVVGSRHFTVNGSLVLQNITLDGGSIGGGVIVNSGAIFTMNDGTVIRSCIASNGGAVQVSNGGSFQMNGGTIAENRSSGTGSANGGGGIFGASSGIIQIVGGVISNNTAAAHGGGVFGYTIEISGGTIVSGNTAESNGGGIYGNTGSNITFGNCIISGNKAHGSGGGIYLNSSSAAPGILAAVGALISGNLAVISGGGIYGYSYSHITADGCTIRANSANGSGSPNGGGGIYGYSYSSINIGGGAISANVTAYYGGGIFGYTNSQITVASDAVIGGDEGSEGNRAITGGGICAYGSSSGVTNIIVNRGMVKNNYASASGGGIACTGNTAFAININTVIDNNSEISYNTAGTNGGGIYILYDNILNFNSSTMISNNANNGGGIYANGSSTRQPTVNVENGMIAFNAAATNGGGIFIIAAKLSILGGIINQNTTAGIGGGICSYHDFRGASSVIGATYASQVTIKGSGITGNAAASGGGIGCFNVFDSAGNNNVAECFITVEESEINGNIATGNGGGIYCYAYSQSGSKYARAEITVRDGNINGNTTYGSGGGIYSYNYGGSGTVRASCIITIENGGGVSNNTATVNGGGICGMALTSSVCGIIANNGIVSRNTALVRGGGIYVTAPATVEISEASFITNNSARNDDGGGIYTEAVAYNNLTTGNGTMFSGNSALRAFNPPANAATLYPNIQFASTSIANHPLNNYDINFASGEPLVFTVAYNPNGGSGGYMDANIPYGTEYAVLSPEETGISREGYTFTGWNTAPDGSGTVYEPGDMITITGNVALHAQWTAPDLYSVSYNANGGSGGHVDTDIPYGVEYTVLSSQEAGISRIGYAFTGWNTEPGGVGTSYVPGDLITITDNLVLYTQWTVDIYTIVYNANGGSGSMYSNVFYGDLYTILSPEQTGISREGYTFIGWNTQPDGSGMIYQPSDVVVIEGDLTLYAQWTVNQYVVFYNANGGNGEYMDANIPHGAEYTVLSPEEAGISREGYIFTGWNTLPDSSGVTYQPGNAITITGHVTLYAQWMASSLFTVTYHANGGTGGYSDANIPYGAEYTVLSPEEAGISREGYIFTGWNTLPDGSGVTYQPGNVIPITGHVTLYAQWRHSIKLACPPSQIPCCPYFTHCCCSLHSGL